MSQQSSSIYLDHAAASPLRPAIFKAMEPFLTDQFGNASAITRLGVIARAALDDARQKLAITFGAHPDEIIFTSGGTESTNLAIQGIIRTQPSGHIVTTAIEHHAVLEPIAYLNRQGYQTTAVPVPTSGVVAAEAILAAIQPNTRLVSVMLANNEIGTLQPLAELARAVRRLNRQRAIRGLAPLYLHTDACQAAAYLPLNADQLGIDALSLNSAKVGGPKGMGVLYLRRGTPLEPILVGGGQEAGRRAGTENVAAIVGGAAAIELAQRSWSRESERLVALANQLLQQLQTAIPGLVVNGDMIRRLPNNLNLTIPGLDAEALLLYLEADGVTIGTGAACSSLTLEPSHVLRAIGLSDQAALSTIRLTLGWNTTADNVTEAVKRIISRIRWIRQHNR